MLRWSSQYQDDMFVTCVDFEDVPLDAERLGHLTGMIPTLSRVLTIRSQVTDDGRAQRRLIRPNIGAE